MNSILIFCISLIVMLIVLVIILILRKCNCKPSEKCNKCPKCPNLNIFVPKEDEVFSIYSKELDKYLNVDTDNSVIFSNVVGKFYINENGKLVNNNKCLNPFDPSLHFDELGCKNAYIIEFNTSDDGVLIKMLDKYLSIDKYNDKYFISLKNEPYYWFLHKCC